MQLTGDDHWQALQQLAQIWWLILPVVYVLGGMALGAAWCALLRQQGIAVPLVWGLSVYGRSQLAKYVPGNIFHFAGRQALAMAAGLSAKPVLATTFWELAGQAMVAAWLSLLALSLFWSPVGPYIPLLMLLLLLVFSLLLARTVYLMVLKAMYWQLAFLLVFVVLMLALFFSLSTASISWLQLGQLVGVFAAAWLLGFVVPGAPGGVGVRELVLLWGLSGFMADERVLLLLIAGRLVTTVGDVLVYFVSVWLSQRSAANFTLSNV
ncbi:hypothetical protein GCM10011297_06060 [Bacterioplanes sanyensis]|uniref:hypothetical protein n=1 Tax=Bacterioplanes sanyensis TaxID=1249553 RepID=UPI00167A5989|nr:hypothetical protein [Bacterioplanes sanyensis]GGY35834.1 hypothetical protein GCM10011297_06060 [Bacterioplanes sanyensis]